MIKEKRYWDSDVIISFLQGHPSRIETCKAIFQKAKLGEIQLFVSVWSIIEVIKLEPYTKIPKDDKIKVLKFFESSFITKIAVNYFLARDAQNLVWNNGISQKDSLHVATAELPPV